jgi:DNA-binding NtrC family response regulator
MAAGKQQTEKLRVLVVDDDPSIGDLLGSILEMEGYPYVVVHRGEDAIETLEAADYDLVFSDIYMGDVSGLDVLEAARRRRPGAEVVIMTAHGSVETAVHAVRNGAFDYISKPFVVSDVLSVVRRIEERSRAAPAGTLGAEVADQLPETEIVGTSRPMAEIYKKIARIASIDSPALITGETGSGKELVARAIHRNSGRFHAPFVVINCGTLTETLLEAELFGHEKGAFTGAFTLRKGLLESASGGTVFLDEISETSLAFQVKLLRVIQEHEIRRVGSNDTIGVDIRPVAATNKDLRDLVRKGEFREDLLHRLDVFTITLPPLRERIEDIPILASYFLKRYGEEYGRDVRLLSDALAEMKKYRWPGNVRELKNVIERAFAFAENGVIGAGDLDLRGDDADGDAQPGAVAGAASGPTLAEMERDLIVRTLEQTGGNKKRAAEILGIERRTLYNKARRFGIDLKRTGTYHD